MKNEISVAYSKDVDYYESQPVKTLSCIDDLQKKVGNKIDSISYICFVSGAGIYIELEEFGTDIFPRTHFYIYENPKPDILEYLCQINLSDSKANAKMWYCAFKYSLENEDCIAFWEKYKKSSAGTRFMSLILGQKETLDHN